METDLIDHRLIGKKSGPLCDTDSWMDSLNRKTDYIDIQTDYMDNHAGYTTLRHLPGVLQSSSWRYEDKFSSIRDCVFLCTFEKL